MPRPKRQEPYNPALAEYQRQQAAIAEEKRRDRKATDLLRNARVAPMEVADPISEGTIVVMRSLRNDILAQLHSHRQIDEAQYQGGREFQKDFETAERGPQAIDPSKEYVDGGKAAEPITEAMRKSVLRLATVHARLGENGSAIIHDVLIAHYSLDQVAARRQMVRDVEIRYIGRRFKECLDCLALIYGFSMEARK